MSHPVYLQILKVNELREGVGRESKQPYRMQDCECAILTETGEIDQVGVLMLTKEQVGNTVPGIYVGTFALRADTSEKGGRKIGARIVTLKRVKRSGTGFVLDEPPAPAPAPAPASSKA